MSTVRPSVRILCVDSDERVLLYCWRDPHDGKLVWEPPGGGIDEGESELEAAHRELFEETGFKVDLDEALSMPVECDVVWNGIHHEGYEQFFLARFDQATPEPSRDHLLGYETDMLVDIRWLSVAETASLQGLVLPADLPRVVADMLQLDAA